MRGKVEVINHVIHERKVLDKVALDRMRERLYGVWENGYSRGKADAEYYLLHCGDETPITNADRIRSMTDEKLDEFLNEVQGDAYLVGFHARAESRFTPYGKRWLDWLKEEVSE